MERWYKALRLDVPTHITILNKQSASFQHRNAKICLWHSVQVYLDLKD